MPLTSLDDLAAGKLWPPRDEQTRLDEYDKFRRYFEGDHRSLVRNWNRLQRETEAGDKFSVELVLNWPKRLSKLWVDLLLGEKPRATAGGDNGGKEQAELDRLILENDLWNVAKEVAFDVSRFGTGVFKVRWDATLRRAVIEAVPPALWFPVVKPDNIKEIVAHVLAWTWEEVKPGPGNTPVKHKYLKAEVHEKGRVATRTYEMQDKTIKVLVGDDGGVQSGVPDFLVVPVHNLITSDRVTGISDYADLETILEFLEVRFSQVARILDKHADPTMYGPEGALIYKPETDSYVFKSGSYIPVGRDEGQPGYVTWNGNLAEAFKEIDYLMAQLYAISETSPAAFGEIKSGLAESGSALRRLLMAPLAKVAGLREHFDPAIKKVLRLAAALEVAKSREGAVELTNVSLEWQDGLPADDREATENVTQQYAAGLISLEQAVRKLYGLDGEALAAELDRIREARQAQAVANPEPDRPRVTLPATG